MEVCKNYVKLYLSQVDFSSNNASTENAPANYGFAEQACMPLSRGNSSASQRLLKQREECSEVKKADDNSRCSLDRFPKSKAEETRPNVPVICLFSNAKSVEICSEGDDFERQCCSASAEVIIAF